MIREKIQELQTQIEKKVTLVIQLNNEVRELTSKKKQLEKLATKVEEILSTKEQVEEIINEIKAEDGTNTHSN